MYRNRCTHRFQSRGGEIKKSNRHLDAGCSFLSVLSFIARLHRNCRKIGNVAVVRFGEAASALETDSQIAFALRNHPGYDGVAVRNVVKTNV